VVAEYLVHGGRTSFSEDREHNFHVVKVFDFEDDRVVHFHEYCDSYYSVAVPLIVGWQGTDTKNKSGIIII